jgi:hypothetical protein
VCSTHPTANLTHETKIVKPSPNHQINPNMASAHAQKRKFGLVPSKKPNFEDRIGSIVYETKPA